MVGQTKVDQGTITVFHVYETVHSIPLTNAIDFPEGSTIKDLIARIGGDSARDAHAPEARWMPDGPLEHGTAYETRNLNFTEQIQKYHP